jgi:large subunit ribosomal protein L21
VLYLGGVESPQWGKPTVAGASVTVTIVEQAKGKKINAFTFKPKKNIHKHWGHRQQLTRVRVESISAG